MKKSQNSSYDFIRFPWVKRKIQLCLVAMSFNRQSICLSPTPNMWFGHVSAKLNCPTTLSRSYTRPKTNWLTKTLIHQSNYEGNLFKMNWFSLSFYNFQKQKYKWHKGIGFLASHLSSFKQTKKYLQIWKQQQNLNRFS